MLKLRLLTGPRAGRQLRVSDTKPVSVGRRVGRLRLHDSRVSKRHAKIFFAGGTWVLRDLGSANGTYVNQRKCDGLIELETGDMVQMGRVLIKVLQADAVGMDPMRAVPGTSGTQASSLGVDAFTASGATGQLPAIDPGTPIQSKPDAEGEIDLASIFGEDNTSHDDDLIDFSDQSRADASRVGTVDAGQTQASDETIELDPVQDDRDASTAPPIHDALADRTEQDDPLLAKDTDPQPVVADTVDDLIDIQDDVQPSSKLGTTMLAAIDPVEQDDDADEDKPAVVGLRLDQPAPQQPPAVVDEHATAPEPVELAIDEVDDVHDVHEVDDVDDLVVRDADADLDTPVAATESEEDPAHVDSAEQIVEIDDSADDAQVDEMPVQAAAALDAVDDVETDQTESPEATQDAIAEGEPEPAAQPTTPIVPAQPAARAADASLTDSPVEDADAEPALDLETAHAELAFDDIAEQGPPPIDPDILALELWPIEDEPADQAPAPSETEDETQAHADVDDQGQVSIETHSQSEPSSAIENEPDVDIQFDLEPDLKDETEAEPESEPEPEADNQAPTAAVVQATDEPPLADEDTAESSAEIERLVQGDLSDQAEDDAAEGVAQTEPVEPVEVDSQPAEPAGFDIDAAFDALSVGLDDSVQLPAITDEPETEPALTDELESNTLDPTQEHAAQDNQGIAEIDADDLAGSQLDIGFIRDALAKLGDGDVDGGETDPPTSDPAEPVSAALDSSSVVEDEQEPLAHTQQDEDEAEADSEPVHAGAFGGSVPQPIVAPPGLNPTSVRPPSEPSRSHRTGEKRKLRWFFTTLSMLVVFGLGAGVAYLFATQSQSIAGRGDNSAPDTQPPPRKPDPSDNAQPPSERPDPNRDDQPVTPNNPYTTPPFDGTAEPNTPSINGSSPPGSIAGAAPVPAPFAEGPPVIGRTALAGMIHTGSASSQDPLPTPNRPTRPGVVIQPDLPDIDTPTTPQRPSDPIVTPEPTDNTPVPTPNPLLPQENDARIVFLVDASGSLVDSLPQMLVWLGEAVQTIEDNERFTVIFFKAGKAIEPTPAGLQAPTREVLATFSREWLNPQAAPVLPTGRSDPSKAIAQALSYDPTDIYLLSDESFARYAGDTTRDQAVKLVADALGQTEVKLHGVQFFYRDEGGVLETLSNRYNGTFEFVKEDVIPDADPIDLLEELDKSE